MASVTLKDLGALLRKKRQEAGLDLSTAAIRAGVGRRLLLELETGKRPNVSFSTLLHLLTLFGLELHVVPRGSLNEDHTLIERRTMKE